MSGARLEGMSTSDVRHMFRRRLARSYAGPGAVPKARVVLIQGDRPSALAHGIRFKPDYGWRTILGSDLEVHRVPGDHIGHSAAAARRGDGSGGEHPSVAQSGWCSYQDRVPADSDLPGIVHVGRDIGIELTSIGYRRM